MGGEQLREDDNQLLTGVPRSVRQKLQVSAEPDELGVCWLRACGWKVGEPAPEPAQQRE